MKFSKYEGPLNGETSVTALFDSGFMIIDMDHAKVAEIVEDPSSADLPKLLRWLRDEIEWHVGHVPSGYEVVFEHDGRAVRLAP